MQHTHILLTMISITIAAMNKRTYRLHNCVLCSLLYKDTQHHTSNYDNDFHLVHSNIPCICCQGGYHNLNIRRNLIWFVHVQDMGWHWLIPNIYSVNDGKHIWFHLKLSNYSNLNLSAAIYRVKYDLMFVIYGFRSYLDTMVKTSDLFL